MIGAAPSPGRIAARAVSSAQVRTSARARGEECPHGSGWISFLRASYASSSCLRHGLLRSSLHGPLLRRPHCDPFFLGAIALSTSD